jgi:hypothetical protein
MGWYRAIRTTSERRFVSGYEVDREEEEYDVPPVRGRRKHLPSSWDDKCRSDYGNRSWKRHRKTQWKPKGLPREKKEGKFRGHTCTRPIFQDGHMVWAYEYVRTRHEWNPDGFHWTYKFGDKVVRRVQESGCWEPVHEWKWRSRKVRIIFYEDEKIKIYHVPVVKQEPGFLNGQPHFVPEGYGIKWETIIKRK